MSSVLCNVFAIGLFAQRFRADPELQGTARAAWLVAVVTVIVANTALWHLIAVRASSVTRWIYIVLTGLGALTIPQSYGLTLRYGWLYGALMIGCYGCGFASAALLLRRDVARWLGSRGRVGEVDLAIFD